MSFWTRHHIFEKNSIVLIGGILAVSIVASLLVENKKSTKTRA